MRCDQGQGREGGRAGRAAAAAVRLPPSHTRTHTRNSPITPCTRQGSLTIELPSRVASRSSCALFQMKAQGAPTTRGRSLVVVVVVGSLSGCVCVCVPV